MALRARAPALALLGLGAISCSRPSDCVPREGSEPDYAEAQFWACRPDASGDACDIDLRAVEILPDGSTTVVEHTPDPSPAIDCFYVYPTVDLRALGAGLHDDLSDHADADRTIAVQAARFSEVCRIFAPLYRQVTVGTYAVRREEIQNACFDVADGHVLAAFEHYVDNDNDGRGFVLLGHSQGAQITSRLLRERVETDPALRARLVAAAPIGWPIGVGGPTGGSFPGTPVCTSAEQTGCVIGYRTYADGQEIPAEDPDVREGATSICVHPSDVAGGGPAPLHRTYFPSNLEAASWPDTIRSQAPFVLYRDLYEAECVTEGDTTALRVHLHAAAGDTRTSPIDFTDGLQYVGTHIYDVQFTLGDLITLIGDKADAYAAR